MGTGRDGRERKRGRVLIGVLAAVLFLGAGVSAVRLVTEFPELDWDGSGAGSEAAARMRTVVATGVLSAPPGGTLETSPACGGDSAGEPLLRFIATAPPAATPALTTMDDRLVAKGWVREPVTAYSEYSKQFGYWTARLHTQPGALEGKGFRGALAVQGDIGADCATLRDEVRSIARIPSGPLPPNHW